jgi:hypothetical protein
MPVTSPATRGRISTVRLGEAADIIISFTYLAHERRGDGDVGRRGCRITASGWSNTLKQAAPSSAIGTLTAARFC